MRRSGTTSAASSPGVHPEGQLRQIRRHSKGKRGTSEVDADFLATIEGWRADLARNLALRNPALSQRELNFAVQRILDRIIFLRICEDRGIEDYERLKRLLRQGCLPRAGQTLPAGRRPLQFRPLPLP
jgi:hypothetical protein